MIDPKVVARASAQFDVPPAITYAVGLHDGVLDGGPNDSTTAATTAQQLSTLFQQNQSWEKAIAAYTANDPNHASSPTHPAGQAVAAIMGVAGSQPDYGMRYFQPTDQDAWQAGAEAFRHSLEGMSQHGGIVTPDGVRAFDSYMRILAPDSADAQNGPVIVPPSPQQPPRTGPDPRDVAAFVSEAKKRNIDPQHFANNYGLAANLGRRLLGAPPSLAQFGQMNGMTPPDILAHMSNHPHPDYPDVTAGAYHRAMNTATLYAGHNIGRMPVPAEAHWFASSGANEKMIQQYYEHGKPKEPAPQKPQAPKPEKAAK